MAVGRYRHCSSRITITAATGTDLAVLVVDLATIALPKYVSGLNVANTGRITATGGGMHAR